MQASGRVTGCCVALVITLACASALQTLNSISDLKTVDFGQFVPKHSLLLLHWFANMVEIDNNNVIQLTFDPDGDYGSHYYGNIERMLDRPRQGYRYYTIGNLNVNSETHRQLPDHVIHPQWEYDEGNRDRIIISVRGWTIEQVFLTQHYDTWEQNGTEYDPNHTYQITTNLLRQIQEFPLRDNHWQLSHLITQYQSGANIINLSATWGHLACLGLFLFIVLKEKHKRLEGSNRPSLTQSYSIPSWDSHSYHNVRVNSVENTLENCCCFTLIFICVIIIIFFAMLINFHQK